MNDEKIFGAEVNIKIKSREDFAFFSESQSRVVISINPNAQPEFEKLAMSLNQKFELIGKVNSTSLKINHYEFNLEELVDLYYNSLPKKMSVLF